MSSLLVTVVVGILIPRLLGRGPGNEAGLIQVLVLVDYICMLVKYYIDSQPT